MDFDPATKARLKLIYPDMAIRVIRLIGDMQRLTKLSMRVSEGFRTFDRQAELYASGRTAKGPILTNARAGESMHHYGCAVDLCFRGLDPYLTKLTKDQRDEVWKTFGRLATAYGFDWGGDWNGNGRVDKNDFDRPHIQCLYGLQPDYIRELYRVNGTRAVWGAFRLEDWLNSGSV